MAFPWRLTVAILAGVTPGLGGAVAIAHPTAASPASDYVQPPLTKDRLTDEALRGLVAEPLAEMLAGDIADGERDLEALVKARSGQDGSATVAAADTLGAMGILLFA